MYGLNERLLHEPEKIPEVHRTMCELEGPVGDGRCMGTVLGAAAGAGRATL